MIVSRFCYIHVYFIFHSFHFTSLNTIFRSTRATEENWMGKKMWRKKVVNKMKTDKNTKQNYDCYNHVHVAAIQNAWHENNDT